METVVFIVCIIGVFAMAICAFIMVEAQKQERRELEEKLKEAAEHEKKMSEIITEANKTKAEANSGSFHADSKYMADKLHDHANK